MPHSVATPTECLTVTMFVSAALNSSSSKLGGVNDGAVLCGGFTFISQMLWSVGGRIVSVDCVIISLVMSREYAFELRQPANPHVSTMYGCETRGHGSHQYVMFVACDYFIAFYSKPHRVLGFTEMARLHR